MTQNPFDLTRCQVCAKECGVDRMNGGLGVCLAPEYMEITGWFAHKNEEPCLTGTGGSGTIFFSGCSLHCVFCHSKGVVRDAGVRKTPEDLADAMLGLQRDGCVNVNLVTPSHYLPQIYEGWSQAKLRGFKLPVVYNSSGYDSVASLRHAEGLVDIFLPDLKTLDNDRASRWFNDSYYPEVARAAILEMRRQVGPLQTDANGIAQRGLIVRHLVMPNASADAENCMEWLSKHIPGCSVSILGQYRPMIEDPDPVYDDIRRRPTPEEFRFVVDAAQKRGLTVVNAR